MRPLPRRSRLQTNTDGDAFGDVCDSDDDNGTTNIVDIVLIRRHIAGAQVLDPAMPPEP